MAAAFAHRVTAPALLEDAVPTPMSRSAKVVALTAGNALASLAGMIFWMVAARSVSKYDYATIRQTFLAYDFVAPLLMLGLPSALYYWLPREKDNQRGVVIDNVALLLAAGMLFSVFIISGGHRLLAARFDNPALRHTLRWLSVYPVAVMPAASLASVLIYADRAKLLARYNVLYSIALTIAGVVAVLATRSYQAPIMARIAVPIVFAPIAVYLMLTAVPGPVRRPSWPSMSRLVTYSLPIGLAFMISGVSVQLHSIIVASLASPQDFAIYVNGAMELPIVGIVTGSITVVIFAEMSYLVARGEVGSAHRLFQTASIKSACLLFPAMCFFLATAVPFVTFLYSDRYAASAVPFVIYLFVLPARIVVYTAALSALGMQRVVLARTVVDLVLNGLLAYVMVRLVGYIGAAIASVLTLYFWTIPFNIHMIAKGFGVRWQEALPFRQLSRVLLLSVLCIPFAAVGSYGFALNAFGRLSLAAVLYWPVLVLLLYRAGFLTPNQWLTRYIPVMMRARE